MLSVAAAALESRVSNLEITVVDTPDNLPSQPYGGNQAFYFVRKGDPTPPLPFTLEKQSEYSGGGGPNLPNPMTFRLNPTPQPLPSNALSGTGTDQILALVFEDGSYMNVMQTETEQGLPMLAVIVNGSDDEPVEQYIYVFESLQDGSAFYGPGWYIVSPIELSVDWIRIPARVSQLAWRFDAMPDGVAENYLTMEPISIRPPGLYCLVDGEYRHANGLAI